MLPYKQKMFREKPYTQCFECIQGSRLKCKKCMNELINDVLQHKHKTQQAKQQPQPVTQPIKSQKAYRLHRQRDNQTLQINTCYGLWMNRLHSRRKERGDLFRTTLSGWPRKRVGNQQMKIKIEVPRFQSWEKRLLARFSGGAQNAKPDAKVHGLSMR